VVAVMMMVHLELLRWVLVRYETWKVERSWQQHSLLRDSSSARRGVSDKEE